MYSNIIHESHTLSHFNLINIFAQMVLGLETLHGEGYYHGNIKP